MLTVFASAPVQFCVSGTGEGNLVSTRSRALSMPGTNVEVINPMPNLTLVRYRNREFLIYTEGLGTDEEICTVES